MIRKHLQLERWSNRRWCVVDRSDTLEGDDLLVEFVRLVRWMQAIPSPARIINRRSGVVELENGSATEMRRRHEAEKEIAGVRGGERPAHHQAAGSAAASTAALAAFLAFSCIAGVLTAMQDTASFHSAPQAGRVGHGSAVLPAPVLSEPAAGLPAASHGSDARESRKPSGVGVPPVHDLSHAARTALRDAMVLLLNRKPADTFATWTFVKPRRDETEVVKAIGLHLYAWQLDHARTFGDVREKLRQHRDGYDRVTCTITKRSGPFVRAMRRGEGLQWAVFVEPHASGDLHAHGLIWWGNHQGELCRRRAWELWRAPAAEGGMNQRISRFEPPRDANAIVGYCAKYCLKTDANMHLSDNLTLPGDLWFSTTDTSGNATAS